MQVDGSAVVRRQPLALPDQPLGLGPQPVEPDARRTYSDEFRRPRWPALTANGGAIAWTAASPPGA